MDQHHRRRHGHFFEGRGAGTRHDKVSGDRDMALSSRDLQAAREQVPQECPGFDVHLVVLARGLWPRANVAYAPRTTRAISAAISLIDESDVRAATVSASVGLYPSMSS
jgi:hypothetical protein